MTATVGGNAPTEQQKEALAQAFDLVRVNDAGQTIGPDGQVVGGGATPETINNRDGLGRVTSYTLGGTTYTVTYGNNGPATISGGGVTRTFNYNATGFLTGYTDA